ncbi:MAG: Gfo/Idh/MocA family oxidoreductase [Pirellulales bacterium]|nr:Gfo/Idh/MocA family oxidoreductase [Pirellulales bacterium]
MHRVLVVGVGSIGERHVRCFQQAERADVSICEPLAERRREVAERYCIQAAFADLDAALAAPFDTAVIATPAHLHIQQALRLAAAGCHLLIEKPLSTSLEGIDELRRAIDERSRVAAVAYVYRAHPALQAMRAAIAAGRFGEPVEIVVQAGQHFPTYRPAYRETYYRDRATGGGAIQDALTHLLNAGEFLVGQIDRVAADAAHRVLETPAVEDTVHVLARHGDVLGSYGLNQHQAPNESSITVVCRRGTAKFEMHSARWKWMTEPGSSWHEEPAWSLERDALFVAQAGAFLDAVEGRAEPLCTLDDGLQTLRVNLAVLAAADSHSWQTVGMSTGTGVVSDG